MLSDRGAALIMIGAVFLYSVFYLAPFHKHIAREIPIGIVNQDNSVLSRNVIRALDANEMMKVSEYPDNLEHAKTTFYQNKIHAFVVIPKNFAHDIRRGKVTVVAVYLDSAYLIVYKQLTSGINEVFSNISAKIEIKSLMKQGVKKRQASMVKNPIDFIQIPLFNPVGSYQNYIYPLVLILVLQQTMLIGIGILSGTREERKIKENEKASVLVLGRGLAYTSLYLIYALIFLLFFPLIAVYHTSHNILNLLLFLVPFLLSIAFLGQMLPAICKTRESCFFILIPSSVPFIFLSGFVWPLEAMPTAVNLFAKLIPSTSAMHRLLRLNQMKANLAMTLGDCLILWILCLFYYCLALQITKNNQQRNNQ
jgi:ABC-2 type transport system permease protein